MLAWTSKRAKITLSHSHLSQSIEYLIEEEQDLSFGHLGNIVHALASIIADPRILIGKAS